MRKIIPLFVSLVFMMACEGNVDFFSGSNQAYVPVYAKPADLNNIGTESARAVEKPGKIYVIGNLLLQNDLNKGVHLIDISIPDQPRKIAFLRIPFSTEISVKNNYLYVNNFNDLLVFNINDPQNPALIKRIVNVFPYHNSEYPPVSNVYFECVDKTKGIVVDWKLESVNEPKCRR